MRQPNGREDPLFWEAVYQVELCEMKVMGATFDGTTFPAAAWPNTQAWESPVQGP